MTVDDLVDTARTMMPQPGNALRQECDRCGWEIDPFEAHHRGRLTGVRWCDECYAKEVDDD